MDEKIKGLIEDLKSKFTSLTSKFSKKESDDEEYDDDDSTEVTDINNKIKKEEKRPQKKKENDKDVDDDDDDDETEVGVDVSDKDKKRKQLIYAVVFFAVALVLFVETEEEPTPQKKQTKSRKRRTPKKKNIKAISQESSRAKALQKKTIVKEIKSKKEKAIPEEEQPKIIPKDDTPKKEVFVEKKIEKEKLAPSKITQEAKNEAISDQKAPESWKKDIDNSKDADTTYEADKNTASKNSMINEKESEKEQKVVDEPKSITSGEVVPSKNLADKMAGMVDMIDTTSSEDLSGPIKYIPPPNYEKIGRGLVYNCKDHHWACVDKIRYFECHSNNLWNKQEKKNPECVPSKEVYESDKDCQIMQVHYINTVKKTSFCNK
jgi:hypothetical protein